MGGRIHGGSRDALEMLERCHQKTSDKIELLLDAAKRWARTGERMALEDMRDVSQFLAQAGRRHALDEELSIFPRLLDAVTTNPERDDLEDMIRVLQAEHRDHHREGLALEELVALPEGPEPEELSHCVARLASAYRAHILLEDRKLMPLVRGLPAHTLGAILAEMQARRGR